LIKERDAEALPDSGAALVDDKPLGVATGRAMETIAADRDRVWDSGKGEIAEDALHSSRKTPAGERRRVAGAGKAAMPDRLVPQLATLADAPPDGAEWLHEIKYDGYRLLARIEKGRVRLDTRNGLDWTLKFPALARALAALPVESALIDGELVALAEDGTTDFGDLQDRIARGDTGGLVFFAFDLLYRDGFDLTGAALEDRKAALAEIVPPGADDTVRYSDHQVGRGPDFFRLACRHHLEGTLAKRRDRPYRAGRGRDWLKIKCHNSDEFVVIGFTEPAGQRHGFGALLLGYYDPGGRLHYAGRVGTGFSDIQLADLRTRLDALARSDPPAAPPKGVSTRGVHWTEPRLVAEVVAERLDRCVRRRPEESGGRAEEHAGAWAVPSDGRDHDSRGPDDGDECRERGRVVARVG
jgi:bifunctional non-homologous end joining protein LigD